MIPNMSGLAALVQSIGSDTFNQQFFDFSRNQWQADQCTIFRLHGEAPPQCLLAEAEQRKTRKAMLEVVQEYTGGAYQRDPNLTTLQHNGFGEGQCRVSCVAPKQIVDIAYRRRFYETLDAAQEMLTHPVQHEFVGRQQPQLRARFDRLQRSYPGIELLGLQFTFQTTQTLRPHRAHEGVIRWVLRCERRGIKAKATIVNRKTVRAREGMLAG